MKKLSLFIISCFLLMACAKEAEKKEAKSEKPQKQTEQKTNNYAVTWKWTTTDVEFVNSNVQQIATELTNLWQEGIVENGYFDTDATIDKLGNFPNVTFFIKAPSKEEAALILDKLTIVKLSIASYTLHPVGVLWLDRNTEAIQKNGMTRSFVTIWTSKLGANSNQEVIKAQNDQMLALWNDGKVENVYFDIEGTQQDNGTTDFVFFINSDSREQAEQLCHELPFYKEDLASYKMYPVGVFWIGKIEQ